MTNKTKVTLLGAGKFGTALRTVLTKGGCDVCSWDIQTGPNIETNLEKALSFSAHTIMAVATQHVRDVCNAIQSAGLSPSQCWIASKGFEKKTGWFLSHVVTHFFPLCTIGILSGPNIAQEMQDGWPCGMTLASPCKKSLKMAQSWFSSTPLILETTDDTIGIQALGGLKNIIAIGYGLLEQSCPSANMHATYLSMVMHEAAWMIQKFGGRKETLSCFAGWADVIVSCAKGRNRQLGLSFPQTPQELSLIHI